jgi:5-methylthioadenosine/S-adenosylhomocysteine deaminase
MELHSKGIKKAAADSLPPIELDPLTVADDKNYFTNLQSEMNLPGYIKTGLAQLYGS